MGTPPHARGGRHRLNYSAVAQRLAPDVHRTDAFAVEEEPTGWTEVDATARFVPMPTARAFLGRVRFVLERDPTVQPCR